MRGGKSVHESIDQLSVLVDAIPKDGVGLLKEDEYLCNKEMSRLLEVSCRTLSEYCGRLPYCILGNKVLYKRSESE